MNSHAMTIEKMDQILIDAQVKTYLDFMQTVISLLIATIALMLVLLIASVLVILMVRNMFKEIYQSFLNITEGEFEERSSQLSQIGEIMSKFKNTYYFQDFMGFKTQENSRQNSNKTNKKYSNNFYCFRLILSLIFIVIFYFIQIVLSSGMMLIFQNSVSTSLWITEKQNMTNSLLND